MASWATTYTPFEIRKYAKNRKSQNLKKKVGFWNLKGSKFAGFAKNSKWLKGMKKEQRGRQLIERSSVTPTFLSTNSKFLFLHLALISTF